jgi:hypothetical protein
MKVLEAYSLARYPSEKQGIARRSSGWSAIEVMTSVVNLVYPSTRTSAGRDFTSVRKAYQQGLRSFTLPDALVDTVSLLLNYVAEHRHEPEFGIFVQEKLWLSDIDSTVDETSSR